MPHKLGHQCHVPYPVSESNSGLIQISLNTKGRHVKMITEYFEMQKKIFEFFGYVEDWAVIPMTDSRDKFWRLDGEGPGQLHYADSEEDLKNEAGDYYMDEIYTQRFLPKWVYRGDGFTMVCCDTQCDGNKLLRILDNSKERPQVG